MIEILDLDKVKNSLLVLKENRLRDVEKYLIIMDGFHKCNVAHDLEYQKRYKGFYRVRRNQEFCDVYFAYMEKHKNESILFEDILNHIFLYTNRIEPSFSSKMLATINPAMPVWDRYVLSQLSLSIPKYYQDNRLQACIKTYNELVAWYSKYEKTQNAKDVIAIFKQVFPQIKITDVKKIDLALWSMGEK